MIKLAEAVGFAVLFIIQIEVIRELAVAASIGVTVLIFTNLKIGDLDEGTPELRPGSQYNQDAGFMNRYYGASSDVLAVEVKTPENKLRLLYVWMRRF